MTSQQVTEIIDGLVSFFSAFRWDPGLKSIYESELLVFDYELTRCAIGAIRSSGKVKFPHDLLPAIVNKVRALQSQRGLDRKPDRKDPVKLYTLIQVDSDDGRERKSAFYANNIPEDVDEIENDAIRSCRRAENIYGGRWAIQRDWEVILGSDAEEIETKTTDRAASEHAEPPSASSPPTPPLFKDADDDIPF